MTSRSQKKMARGSKGQKKRAEWVKTQKTQSPPRAKRQQAPSKLPLDSDTPRCGLCGATKNLTRTECCGQWICDDEASYRLFSYARNSCHRNHRRYTLCGHHFTEEHPGRWQDCQICRDDIETEMYVYYGTNEYNFEVLENPPHYEPTRCSKCGRVIALATETHCYSSEGYLCSACTAAEHPGLYR